MELIINDRIRNRKITLFNKININLKYDSVASTFAIQYYFGELLLTGYVLSITFNSGPVKQMVSIGGYSLTGVLEDSDIPIAIEGMRFDNTNSSLKDIALRYLKPFGIGLVIDGSVISESTQDVQGVASIIQPTIGLNSYTQSTPENEITKTVEEYLPFSTANASLPVPPSDTPQSKAASNLAEDGTYDKYSIKNTAWGNDTDSVTEKMNSEILNTTSQVGQKISHYLAKLASYKNIILTHDAHGNLVFTKGAINHKSVATFKRGVPGTTMSLAFDGQRMHSHITAVQQPHVTGGYFVPTGYMSTLRNPYVPYVLRTKVISVSAPLDGSDFTLKSAKNALCDELRGLRLIITTDRWTMQNGKVFKPNSVITVQNSDIYLYKSSKWFIESVELMGDEKQETAKLTCVIPNVYDYQQPGYLFRNINTH
jgi:prophage tail gpP-like protein